MPDRESRCSRRIFFEDAEYAGENGALVSPRHAEQCLWIAARAPAMPGSPARICRC